jgi:hypothetical protein
MEGSRIMSTHASGSAHERKAAGNHVSRQTVKSGAALKKRQQRHGSPVPRRTLRPYQFLADQPLDSEWAEYVEEVLAKRCYYCDFTNPSDAGECEQCGRPLEIVCPECGCVNLNNPDSPECLGCDAPLVIEEFDPQLLVASTGGEVAEEAGFAPIAGSLILIAIVIAAFTRGDSSGTLIWLALAPLALLAIVTFLYIRAKMVSGNNQE